METPAGTIELQSLGKALGLGAHKIFAVLRERHVLDGDNTPYSQYLTRGYFVVTIGNYQRKDGTVQPYSRTFATAKGVKAMKQMLKEGKGGLVGRVGLVGQGKRRSKKVTSKRHEQIDVQCVISGPDLVLGF